MDFDADDDFFEVLDEMDELEEMEQQIVQPRRPRHIRPRTDLFHQFPDHEFRMRYRLCQRDALTLFQQVEADISHFQTQRNSPLSPINRFLCTLRFYATGSIQSVTGDLAGVHRSTICRVVKEVSIAIAQLRPVYIRMPQTPQQQAAIKTGFFNIAGDAAVPFPGVIGTIDCTHVRIKSPGGPFAETFRNRKGYFSLNVQSISDASLKFQNIVARWHGSAHDSNIFLNSRVNAQFQNGEFGNAHLLGDRGYAVSKHMLTPLQNPVTLAERRYNKSQIKTRNTVERSYGLWKTRFPCLHVTLRTKLSTSKIIIVATAVVHNFCILNRDLVPPPIEDAVLREMEEIDVPAGENELRNNENGRRQAAGTKRRNLVENWFSVRRARDEELAEQFIEEIDDPME